MEKKKFGRTAHYSTRVLFGAAALAAVSKKNADRTMELIIERGINHIDILPLFLNAAGNFESNKNYNDEMSILAENSGMSPLFS